MKKWMISLGCLLLALQAKSQTRVYVAAGVTTSFGGGFNAMFAQINNPRSCIRKIEFDITL